MQRPEQSILQLLEKADILAQCPEETPEQRMATRWLAVNATMKLCGCDECLADIDAIKIRGSSTQRVEFKPRHCTLTASALLFTVTSQMGV